MNEQSRRQFLQSSVAAVSVAGVVGAGVGQQPGRAQESGSVPAYAEWIPDADSILSEQGEINVWTYTFETQLGLFGEVSAGEQRPLQFEPFILTARMVRLWQLLDGNGLAEPVLGSLTQLTTPADADPSGVPADRHLFFGQTSIYTGSFDTGAIEQSVESSDATETEYDGIYEYPNSVIIAWGDSYVIQGVASALDQVATIRNTGDGDRQPRYEDSTQLRQLLAAVDHSGQTLIRVSDTGTLTGEYVESFDYAHIGGASSYIGTLSYDVESTEFDATTVVQYPDGADIDTDQIAGLVTNELSRELTREGQSVRVTARYNRDDVGFDLNSDTNDEGSSDGQDETDGSNSNDGQGDGQNEGDENNGNSSESSDDSGPGFGLVTGLSAVGGAGYLLSQRLDNDEQ